MLETSMRKNKYRNDKVLLVNISLKRQVIGTLIRHIQGNIVIKIGKQGIPYKLSKMRWTLNINYIQAYIIACFLQV